MEKEAGRRIEEGKESSEGGRREREREKEKGEGWGGKMEGAEN